MPLTLKQMRYFVALAEAGSFHVAAARVAVSQPALSQQIKEMEGVLQVRLVDRLPRGVRVTRAGEGVLARARQILVEVADLEQGARWHEGLAGRLHLGLIPTVAPYLLPRALALIRGADVSLDIRIREAQTADLLVALQAGRLDAVVAALPVGDAHPGVHPGASFGAGIGAVPLFDDRFVLAATHDRLAALRRGPEALRPQSIAPDQLLLLDEGHCLADQALEVCGLGARRQVDLGASSLTTLTGLVSQGFGLTLLPELAIETEGQAPGLALTRFAAPEPFRTLALLYRAGDGAPGPWVGDLAARLARAGADAIAHARRAVPV